MITEFGTFCGDGCLLLGLLPNLVQIYRVMDENDPHIFVFNRCVYKLISEKY